MESTGQLVHLATTAGLPHYWWFFVVLGVAAGIVSGLLGVGSGIVVVPALVLLCSVDQKSAQGTALALMVPMALLGAWRYWSHPHIDVDGRIVGWLVCGALFGVLVGTALAARIPGQALRRIFACFLAVVAVRMFFAAKARPAAGDTPSASMQQATGSGGIPDDARP